NDSLSGPGGYSRATAIADTSSGGTLASALAAASGGGSNRLGGIGEATAQAIGSGRDLASATANAFGGDWSGSLEGRGGDATASAITTNSGSAAVVAIASAVGGNARAIRSRGQAGSALATASGFSTGDGLVTVTATQQSGNGGDASDSIMTNAVSGGTRGVLELNQSAIAGQGGENYQAPGGQGGRAVANLGGSFADPAWLSVNVAATGGNGGTTDGPLGTGGNGGAASVQVDVGGTIVSAIGRAQAGHAAFGLGGYGTGGAATADVRATSVTAFGAADAQATALSDASGEANASAEAFGGALARLHVAAEAPAVKYVEQRQSIASAGAAVAANAGGGTLISRGATAYADGLPDLAELLAVSDGDPTVHGALMEADQGLLHVYFSGGYIDGGTGVAQTFSTITDFDIDPALAGSKNLLLGLVAPAFDFATGSAMHFQVLREGQSAVDETFLDALAATAFFDDRVLDLGLVTDGVQGNLNVQMRFDFTAGSSSDGFRFEVLSATSPVPLPGAGGLLVTCLGFLGAMARRKRAGHDSVSRHRRQRPR
ncbi:MAG: hypothetical protein ABI661_10980, partial [Gammaproteobacteria bacterium]